MNAYDELRLSEKVTLHRGDRIRVSRGPYWKAADGRKISMAERGVMTFLEYVEDDAGNQLIRGIQNGVACIVILKRGRRRSAVEGLKYRPYRVVKCRVKKEPKAKRNRKER